MNEMENMVNVEEIENVEVTELVPTEETSGGSALGTLVKVGLVVGAAAVVGFVAKKSKKLKEWRFNRACKLVEENGYDLVPAYDIYNDASAEIVEESAE